MTTYLARFIAYGYSTVTVSDERGPLMAARGSVQTNNIALMPIVHGTVKADGACDVSLLHYDNGQLTPEHLRFN